MDDLAPVRPAMQEPAFERLHDLWRTATIHDCWPCRHAVMSTVEDIRYANELRDRLRERYMRMPKAPSTPWCVSVD